MFKFAQRALKIKPSATLSFNAYAKNLKQQGRDITMFTAGQPDYEPPKLLLEATKNAIDTKKHAYIDVLGDLTLRARIGEYLTKYNLNYSADEIAISTGVKLALANTLLALIDPEDEVIYPRVAWGSYIDMVTLCGGKSVPGDVDQNCKLTPAGIQKSLTEKTKAIIINSPSNPTGTVYNRAELIEIAKIAVKNQLAVISDEIYSEMVFAGEHISIAALEKEVPGIRALTCTLNGASKTIAIPGWRLGYVAAPAEMIEKIDCIQGANASNATSIVQYGFAEVLKPEYKTQLEAYLAEKRTLLKQRRDLFIAGLNKIEYNSQPAFEILFPDGAFYLWVNFSRLKGEKYGTSSKEFRDKLLNDAGIAVTHGSAFGNDDYVRFSYAVDQSEIEKGLEKLKKFVQVPAVLKH